MVVKMPIDVSCPRFYTIKYQADRSLAGERTSQVQLADDQPWHGVQCLQQQSIPSQCQLLPILLEEPDDMSREAKRWVIHKVQEILKGRWLCLPNSSNRNRRQLENNLRRSPKIHGNIDRRLTVVDAWVAAAKTHKISSDIHVRMAFCICRFSHVQV